MMDLKPHELNIETRFTVIHDVSEGVKLTWGANETFNQFNEDYILYQSQTFSTDFTDHLIGGFFESEIKFTKNLAIRPGLRSEYSSVINQL
jgi:outer membrane receptor for ferrienterochelin and colicin